MLERKVDYDIIIKDLKEATYEELLKLPKFKKEYCDEIEEELSAMGFKFRRTGEFEVPIEDLEISVEAYNFLKDEGYNTLDDLVNSVNNSIIYIDDITGDVKKEIISMLVSKGFRFPESPLIENLGFSVETCNFLKSAGYDALKDLKCLTYNEVVAIPGITKQSINEIGEKIGRK